MSDKEDLNLDGQQVRETQNNLNRSNDTVELRLKETYCWLLVPFIDQFEDMKTIQWEISDLGGGSDTIATKAARKMLQAEQIITKLAPAPLQMTLDDLLWRDADHIQIKKLWEYLSTYCYLPRLSSYSVLEEAIYQGLASDEYFGLAAMYANDRYVDLKWNQTVFNVNSTDLLVKPHVAKAQHAKEKQKTEDPNSGTNVNPGGQQGGSAGNPAGNGATGGTGSTATDILNRHFFMSADIDPVRVNKVVSTYVDEIVRYLMQVDGATVELKLEVDVTAPSGIPTSTVRTVSERDRRKFCVIDNV